MIEIRIENEVSVPGKSFSVFGPVLLFVQESCQGKCGQKPSVAEIGFLFTAYLIPHIHLFSDLWGLHEQMWTKIWKSAKGAGTRIFGVEKYRLKIG